nr:MAG TPA: DNA polymerase B [Caudoviricetes sp.]
MIIPPEKFPYDWLYEIPLVKRKSGNQKTRRRIKYKDLITAFDIETTRLVDIEQSIMYVWQWQFGDEYTVVGRTWEQFERFQRKLASILDDSVLVVFVHNLSFEFQFLRGIYEFKPEDVFAIKSRKVLKCNMHDKFEFRCSYIHSNMNLDTYTKKMGVKHKKLTGKFDYDKIRYPWTELTDDELAYCVHDVQGLVEAIEIEMSHDKDNLYTFPLTSTGYVRRDAKKAMAEVSKGFIKTQLPDYETYKMLREAFRGGNTHANRYYTNYTLHNVHSADRSSSYPDVMCNCKFPISGFYRLGDISNEEAISLIGKRQKACLMRVAITGIYLTRLDWGCPYLSTAKCRHIENPLIDNGRIISADYLETTITDIDLKIILGEYSWKDIRFFDFATSIYGYLPKQLIKTICQYYHYKTELKNVKGQELLYMKSKNKLNSLYGMCAQDPVKQSILFIEDDFKEQNDNESELLLAHNKKAFLAYQWGVWVTAWARYRLEEGIQLAHGDTNDPDAPQFVYCDTDSVKYLGEINLDKFNADRIRDSKESGAYAVDPSGITHYMGVYEKEHDMCEFRTMGAKKYVYRETPEDRLVCTIAGVSKNMGGKELEEHGGVEAFHEGFTFEKAGGLEAVYNDKPSITEYQAEGRTVKITSNVCLRPSTYTLGLAADYKRLLTETRYQYE